MKNYLKKISLEILFLLVIILVSCSKITYSDTKQTYISLISNQYIEATSVWEYHYGYSVLYGKYCYHYGENNKDEKYIVVYKFLNDTIQTDDKKLYNSLKDSLLVEYKEVYKDSIFYENNIEKIITK